VRFFGLAIALALLGCSSQAAENANKCGVTEDQLARAIDKVAEMPPYSGSRLGQCDLIVDDGHNVAVITPEIQQRVEKMLAQEKTETKD